MRNSLRYPLAAALVVAGLVLLTRPWWTGFGERRAQQRLAQEFQGGIFTPPADQAPPPAQPAPQEAPAAAPPVKPPPVYSRLQVPAIGLDTYVVEGVTLDAYEELLTWGPGHLVGTPAPGANGNVVIIGHRDEYGSPFRNLYKLKTGDPVVLAAGGKSFSYQVERVLSVAPDDVAVIGPIQGVPALTLITCTGPGNSQRLVVRAAILPPARSPQKRT